MKVKHLFLWLVVLSAWCVPALDATPVLTLNPVGGSISGAAGSTIGWGFTLSNPDNTYAVITSADFCGAVISSPCSTPLGVFNDFIAQYNFTVVGPGDSISDVFSAVNYTGIGSYTLNGDAAGTFLGQLVLTYDLYSDGPGDGLLTTDQRLTATASVSAGNSTAVPEPAPLSLLLPGLAVVGLVYRRNQRRSNGAA